MLYSLKKMLKKLKKSLGLIKTKEIVDIIAFGSAVKGKLMPNDVDVCVVFRERINDESLKEIEIKLKKININAHLSTLIVDNFFTKPHSLIRTMLNEGISVFTGKPVAEQYGLSSYSLYSYSLEGMKASNKVRFVYALKGRKGEKGLIRELGGEWIADSCFIVSVEKDNEIIEILKRWNIKYKRKFPLLIG